MNSQRIAHDLDSKREDLAQCYDIISTMIETYDAAAQAATKRDHLLGIQSEDIDYLWGEIHKLQDAIHQKDLLLAHHDKQVSGLRKHADALRELLIRSGMSASQIPAFQGLPGPLIPVKNCSSNSRNKQTRKDVVEKQFFCGLDAPESALRFDTCDTIHLGGWCVDASGAPAKRIWVAIGNRKIPCVTGRKRNDVVEAFQGELNVAINCGFKVEIEADQGSNFLRIWAEFNSGARHCLMHRTIVKVNGGQSNVGQLDQNYEGWVDLFDKLTTEKVATMQQSIRSMETPPLISVLLPTYNTDERLLSEAIESVRSQIYPHWQLCIADDASPKPHVKQILEHYSNLDSRIVHVIRQENGHISAATNSALELVEGEFCALLDHDDVLPRHALFHVAELIVNDPTVDLIYSDEDKIDMQGKRFDPYFKSDWNPELFQSHNCISHLGVYRTSVLREIGGFREELFGSQDWDLAFRFIEKAGEQGIRHIPKVLYHWRYLDSSTSKSIESKPYALLAGQRAIENFLKTNRQPAIVENGTWAGSFRVKPILNSVPTVSMILLEHDKEKCKAAIEALVALTEYPMYEVVLVADLPETEDSSFLQRAVKRVGGLDANNDAKSFNNAVRQCSGEILVFLDSAITPDNSDWLTELCGQVQKPNTAVAGAWQRHRDGTTHSAGLIVKDDCSGVMKAFRGLPGSDIGHMGRAHLIQRYSAVSKECFVTKRSMFETLHGFSENYPTFLWNVDYCLRAKMDAGKFTLWSPYSKVWVKEMVSDQTELESELNHFKNHWGPILPRDPYFNPNLDLNDPRFFLSWPPR